jgi:Flp pilus assembly protein TadD
MAIRAYPALISDDSSVKARQASAMAMLLTGRNKPAVIRFERLAAEKPADAKLWSDLGVPSACRTRVRGSAGMQSRRIHGAAGRACD